MLLFNLLCSAAVFSVGGGYRDPVFQIDEERDLDLQTGLCDRILQCAGRGVAFDGRFTFNQIQIDFIRQNDTEDFALVESDVDVEVWNQEI